MRCSKDPSCGAGGPTSYLDTSGAIVRPAARVPGSAAWRPLRQSLAHAPCCSGLVPHAANQKPPLQQLGVEPVGFRPARFPRYRDTRGMDKVCLDATLSRPARQPEAVATRFKGQCIRVVGQRSICSAGQCPVGSAIFGCFMAQIIFSKAAAITIYPSENRGCHLPRGVRGSPRKARICLRLREYYRDFWQLSRLHEGSHPPKRRTRKTRYPNLHWHGAALVMRFEPMRH